MKKGWQTKTLGEVCSFLNRGISPRYIETGGLCVLNQKCIRDHRVSYEPSRRHDAKAKRVGSERLIQAGDVLVNSTGTGTLGRVAQLRDNPPEPTTVDSHVTIVRPMPRKFYPEFFGYMLIVIEDAIKEAGEGCGGQTELARSVLAEEFPVHYPESLPEQQRIVGILDEAFEGIATAKANAERSLHNARALFESHLQFVFTQRGDGWVEKRLGELAELKGRIGWRGLTAKEYTDSGPLFLSVHSLNYGDYVDFRDAFHISEERYEESPEIILQTNDILICKDGAGIGKLGIVGTLQDKTTINSSLLLIRSGKSIHPKFLYWCLSSEYFQKIVNSRLNGATTPHLYQRDITEFPILLPPFSDQCRIVSKLNILRAETQRLESIYQQKLAALEALKKSLLHQAFTGKLTADIKAVSASAPTYFPTELEGTSTTDLHAGILALSHQVHEKAGKLEHFGHVKAEKIAHMIEARLGIDLGRNPIKDAAGPNDFPHLHKVEYRARKANWFDFKQVKGAAYRVHKLRGFDRLMERTRAAIGGRISDVDGLLELMLPMQTQQAEIFCTVYAAWNNLLLDGNKPTDEQIVFEARENWHPDKLKIPRERFFGAIGWIRNKSLTPPGKGKKVCSRVG